jgi:DnaD/phage-associated family protein
MAQKRMLSMNIIDTDMFIQMPISARLLYYDFCMRADDDGFIDSPTKIMKMIGCTEDDLKILIAKDYLIPFKNKVCVIKHWLIHNTIRKDRYNPTIHLEERNQLFLNNKIYEFQDENMSGNHLATNWQPSIEKNSYNNSNNILEQPTENIFEIIENEFGRLLSPLEIEMIRGWDYPIEILKLAVQEASTSGQFVIKYIDKILYNWSKANVRTVEDAKKYIINFRNRKERNNQLDNHKSSTYYEEL